MSGWLGKIKKQAQDAGAGFVVNVEDHVQGAVKGAGGKESLTASITNAASSALAGNLDSSLLGPAVQKIQAAGMECRDAAEATIQVCDTTTTKRQELVEFGEEIVSTVKSLGTDGADASSILETIKKLTDGQRVKAAQELATSLKDAAQECVQKSIHMIDVIENSMESLPDPLQQVVECSAGNENHSSVDDLLKDLEKDISDVKTSINSIQQLNLLSAVEVGSQAFEQLANKAQKSKSMFDSIRDFASDVQVLTDAFMGMDVTTVAQKITEVMKCLQMTKAMRLLAEGAGKLIQVVIDLFESTASRISVLWTALAQAKDVMMESLQQLKETKNLCVEAKTRSLDLKEKGLSVTTLLESVGELNASSISAVRDLVKNDGVIQEAITQACSMEDLVLNCSNKVVLMIQSIAESFQKLPKILTEGITAGEQGKKPDDPDPADVAADVERLESCRKSIDESSLVNATKAGIEGFTGVSNTAVQCNDLLERMHGFCGDCEATISNFMDAWDVDGARSKITDMCRIVSLGEFMAKLAEEVKRLVQAIIAVMKAAIAKFSSLDMGSVDQVVGATAEAAENLVDDALDAVKNKFNIFR